MQEPVLKTVKESLFWACANFADIQRIYDEINGSESLEGSRLRIYHSLINGTVSPTVVLGESLPIQNPDKCVYCGKRAESIDHIIPQSYGGREHPDNLVPCCGGCNSSKKDKDLIVWLQEKGSTPSLAVFQRYLKQIIPLCSDLNLMETKLSELDKSFLPFDLEALPQVIGRLNYTISEAPSGESLLEEIERLGGSAKLGLLKHLKACGIQSWNDCDEDRLTAFHDYLLDNLSPGTAKQYSAMLCSVFSQVNQKLISCKDYRSILYIGRDVATKVYLTTDELKQFESVHVKTNTSDLVIKLSFIIECKTGLGLNAIRAISESSFYDGMMRYRLSGEDKDEIIYTDDSTYKSIKLLQSTPLQVTLMHTNRRLRALAERAGITSLIKVHKKGKDIIMRKCDCLSAQAAQFTYRYLFERTFPDDSQAGRTDHFTFSIYEDVQKRLSSPHDSIGRIGLGKMIKRRMIELGLTSADLSGALGIGGNRISGILENEIPANIETIEQILWLLRLELL